MFLVLSKWVHPAETFSLVLTIISVAKEFTRGRKTRLNIIRLCYSRTEKEKEEGRQRKDVRVKVKRGKWVCVCV
jgi:hypothetical protein